ncbi:MAG: response regulator transcription factor [Crocinitomicaceae bacterium]|nr:response regulator transcription factor [Crocinitomicaceae bacterium]
MDTIRILLVDDHDVVRQGLIFILQGEDSFFCDITEAASPAVCHEAFDQNEFDVVLMDVNLGSASGITLTKELLIKKPDLKVIALTTHDEEYIIRQMVSAGAVGYLLKNTGGEELTRAIRTVLNGEKYYSNRVALTLLQERSVKPEDNTATLAKSLSCREVEILQLIVSEMTNEEIAEKLFISKRTVDGHRQKLIGKLGVRNTAGLVKFAIKADL